MEGSGAWPRGMEPLGPSPGHLQRACWRPGPELAKAATSLVAGFGCLLRWPWGTLGGLSQEGV